MQVATLIAVYADWSFAKVKGCGWGWAGVIWIYSAVFYVPLDLMKFAIRYILSGRAWQNLYENKVCISRHNAHNNCFCIGCLDEINHILLNFDS